LPFCCYPRLVLQPQEGLGERLKHAAEDAVHRAEDALHKVEHEVEEVVHKVRLNASLSTQSSKWRCQTALPRWLCLERPACRPLAVCCQRRHPLHRSCE
jgi:hypothetical protein